MKMFALDKIQMNFLCISNCVTYTQVFSSDTDISMYDLVHQMVKLL